jgi:hypothetical protein
VTDSTARRFDLSPSLPFAALIVVAHAAAAIALTRVISGAMGLVLAALVLALGALAARKRGLLLASDSPRHVVIDADSSARIELRCGRSVRVAATGQRRVTRFWLVLPTGPLSSVLVTRGMPGRGDFRRLCVWAIWGRLPARPGTADTP